MTIERAGLSFEVARWQAGERAVAGVDEAGCGSWAGPVVAAAVVFPPDGGRLAHLVGRVDDSKRLSAATRERLIGEIEASALAVGVGIVSHGVIDQIGIVPATLAAMRQAIDALTIVPDYLLLDYVTLPAPPCRQLGIPHGDGLSLSIAAASIVAKVTRDRIMVGLEEIYPGFGFAGNKGYGTAEHRAALVRLGPCAVHRRSYAPVAQLLLRADPQDEEAGQDDALLAQASA